jgi:excisionase family DNA binding protein
MTQKRNPLPMFWTIEEVAEFLKCSKRTVSRHIASGELKSHKIGAAVRISEEDFRAFLAIRRRG